MNQITKDQHYVPRFYLKRFADEEEKIQVFDLQNRRIGNSRHFSSVCYEKFFYGVEAGVFDETSQQFEEWFQGFENMFGNEWNSVITNALNQSLTIKDFDTLSWFLSIQKMRTKKFREVLYSNMERLDKEVMKKQIQFTNYDEIVKELEKDLGETIDKGDFKTATDLLINGDYKINYDNTSFLNNLVRNAKGIRNILFWQEWNIIKKSDKWNFITTDNPVVEWMPKPKSFYGYSIIERDHYFPLSPDILIKLKLGSIVDDVPPHQSVKYRQATDDEVMMYNFLISDHAHSFAYAPDKKEFTEIIDEIEKPQMPLRLYWANYINK